jgi:hypothetical protein
MGCSTIKSDVALGGDILQSVRFRSFLSLLKKSDFGKTEGGGIMRAELAAEDNMSWAERKLGRMGGLLELVGEE